MIQINNGRTERSNQPSPPLRSPQRAARYRFETRGNKKSRYTSRVLQARAIERKPHDSSGVSKGHGRYVHLRPRDNPPRGGRRESPGRSPTSKECDCFNSPTLRRAWARDGPEAAICVQDVDVQCVLQFTLVLAAGCALHRRTSRVIHRSKLFQKFQIDARPSPNEAKKELQHYGQKSASARKRAKLIGKGKSGDDGRAVGSRTRADSLNLAARKDRELPPSPTM